MRDERAERDDLEPLVAGVAECFRDEMRAEAPSSA